MRNNISDYCIGEIEGMIDQGHLILQPDFQRKYIWGADKKANLIDSIMKEWVLPPVLCVKDPVHGHLEVIDGQQRLTTINNFLKDDYKTHEGHFFSGMAPGDRNQLLNYRLVFFIIDDIDQKTIGEYFYRLNDQMALTSVERRNAFQGDFKDQIKTLVGLFEDQGLNDSKLKFDNLRFEYEDILSRVLIYVDQGSLDLDIDHLLTAYYKGERSLKAASLTRVQEGLANFCKILKAFSNNEDIGLWQATNMLTSLYVLSTYPGLYGVNQSDLNKYLVDFERKRCEIQFDIQSLYANSLIKDYYKDLFKAFNKYMTRQPLSKPAVRLRELVVRLLFFENFEFLFYNHQAVSIEEELLFDSLIASEDDLSIHDLESIMGDYLKENLA